MKHIHIKVIPHSEQRYPTCGDYFDDGKTLHFRISDLGRTDWEFLVLIHELIEWFLCYLANVDIDVIDAFDREYEQHRPTGDDSEPGNDPRAPYHTQHAIATAFERLLSLALNVDWKKYEEAINAL